MKKRRRGSKLAASAVRSTGSRVIKNGRCTLTFLTNEEALSKYGRSVVFVGAAALPSHLP
jgi:hypothetical protein